MLDQFRFDRGQFSITLSSFTLKGEDAQLFLQTQSTYNISELSEDGFHLVSFLDPQGRVESYGWLIRDRHEFHFLTPIGLADRSLERLHKFLVSEDVTIEGPVEKKIFFALVADKKSQDIPGWKGELFDEFASIRLEAYENIPFIPSVDVEKWRVLSGWPSFDGSDFSIEVVNNLRLFDLSVSLNKGCYPGQETVSKIATRRGAAFAPVLIETDAPLSPGELTKFDKKIGVSFRSEEWNGKFYTPVNLLRDFRVEKMKITFSLQEKNLEGIVRYYPLLPGDNRAKALEFFYSGSNDFKADLLETAEAHFRLALKLDPLFGDAYEALGVMLGRQERYQEAISLMEKLVEVDPGSVLAHTNMSVFLMKLGRIQEAEEHKSLATVKSFQSFGQEAMEKEKKKQMEETRQSEWAQRESMFREVLGIDPDDTLANYGLGSIALEKGDWKKAKDQLERVLAVDPKYSVAYLALGKALKALGLREEANNIWRQGIKIAAAKGDLMPANQMQEALNS